MEYGPATQLIRNSNEINMDFLHVRKIMLTEGWRAKNITSSFTRIYMIISGSGYLRYGDKEISMVPGGIYVIPSGLTMSYGCIGHLEKVYFHIFQPLSNNLDIFNVANQIFEFHDKEMIDTILENLDGDTALKVMRIKQCLLELTCRCFENTDDIPLHKYSDYVSEIIAYTEKNLSVNLTVEKIADALFTSPAKLRKKFLEETGMSIGKYVDERIMFMAELEVRAQKLSIKEISDKLGFCDQFYFSRCFSRKYGMSPMRYRKEEVYKNMDPRELAIKEKKWKESQ